MGANHEIGEFESPHLHHKAGSLTWPYAYWEHGGATLGPHFGGHRGGVGPVEPLGERVKVARV